MKRLAFAATAVLAIAAQSDAAVIMLNASGQSTLTDPVATKVSPGHVLQPTVVTGSTWFNIRNDSMGGANVRDQNNVIQNGVTIDWGKETGATTNAITWGPTGSPGIFNGGVLTWPSTVSNLYYSNATNALSTPSNTGVLGTATDYDFSIGVRISGLSAGQYNIYLVARNTGMGPAPTTPPAMDVYATTRAGGNGEFSFSPTALRRLSNPAVTTSDTWQQGVNYEVFGVTVTAGDDLIVMSQSPWVDNGVGGSSYTGDKRAALNLIQIVPVPEPTSLAVVGLVGLGALARRRHA